GFDGERTAISIQRPEPSKTLLPKSRSAVNRPFDRVLLFSVSCAPIRVPPEGASHRVNRTSAVPEIGDPDFFNWPWKVKAVSVGSAMAIGLAAARPASEHRTIGSDAMPRLVRVRSFICDRLQG